MCLWSSGDLFPLLNRVWLSPLMPRDDLPIFDVPLQRCVEIQRASLATKRSTFGDLSAEVADTLQLIGSVEMTEGRMKQAHRTMTKVITSHRTQTAQLMSTNMTLSLPNYLGGFNKRPGVSRCVNLHQ